MDITENQFRLLTNDFKLFCLSKDMEEEREAGNPANIPWTEFWRAG